MTWLYYAIGAYLVLWLGFYIYGEISWHLQMKEMARKIREGE